MTRGEEQEQKELTWAEKDDLARKLQYEELADVQRARRLAEEQNAVYTAGYLKEWADIQRHRAVVEAQEATRQGAWLQQMERNNVALERQAEALEKIAGYLTSPANAPVMYIPYSGERK